jgi:hypothetical protein
MSNRGKWLPSGGALAGVVGAFLVFLFIGMPMMVMVLQSGGGCEGLPRPCEPDNTALYIALLALLLLVVGTWWGVRRLVNFFYHGD